MVLALGINGQSSMCKGQVSILNTLTRLLCAGTVAASRNAEVADAISSPFVNMWQDMERGAPILARHPRLCFGTLTALTAVGASYFWRLVHVHPGWKLNQNRYPWTFCSSAKSRMDPTCGWCMEEGLTLCTAAEHGDPAMA